MLLLIIPIREFEGFLGLNLLGKGGRTVILTEDEQLYLRTVNFKESDRSAS